MLTKKIAMMMAAGSAIALLSGCGVPQEEHDAKLAELATANTEIETLKGDLADSESLLNKEKGKVRSLRIELDDASKRITKLKKAEATTAAALAAEKSRISELETAVASAESATGMAQDRTSAVEAELATLRADLDKVQADYDQYKKNMQSLSSMGSSSASPAAQPKPAAKPASGGSALDLLNDMSMQ